MPPDADEFMEEFSGMAVASLIDLFSGYNQITLDERDRDITAIHPLDFFTRPHYSKECQILWLSLLESSPRSLNPLAQML